MLLKQRLFYWLKAVQHGFVLTLPVVMLGAFALTLLQVPHYFNHAFEKSLLLQVSAWVLQGSYGIMALTLVLSISYQLANRYQKKFNLAFEPMMLALLSLATFMSIIHVDFNQDALQHLGVSSVAKGIVCSVIFIELYIFIFRYRPFNFRYLQNDVDNNMHHAIAAIYPALLVPFMMIIVYVYGFSNWEPLKALVPFLIGDVTQSHGLSYFQSTGVILINQLLWFVGIHGSALLETNASLIYLQEQGVLYSRQFFELYAHMGGAGTTLGLIIALLFSCKSDNRQLAKYALVPSIFNINELLIFGLPIVLNRFLLLPFVLAPILSTSIARLAMEMGWLSLSPITTAWSTPIILSGYLSGGVAGVLVQVLGVAASTCLYWPFVKRYDQSLKASHAAKLKSMIHSLGQPGFDIEKVLTARNNLGGLCRRIDKDMRQQLDAGHFEMHYQPKMNKQNQVGSVEALIRWQHPEFGALPPSVFIKIAEATGFIHELGRWVVEACLKDMKNMQKAGMPPLQVAINVSPIQLQDQGFFDFLPSMSGQYSIPPNLLELEITEGQELVMSDNLFQGLKQLSKEGFSIALDDFGMGYTSLRYLQSLHIDTLKLDACLVKDVTKSQVVRDIIVSMSNLSRSRDVKLVAEWVSSNAQYETLMELGCDQFQGRLFSMPINLYDLIKFCTEHSVASK